MLEKEKRITRRSFLHGLGACVTLAVFAPALLPATARAEGQYQITPVEYEKSLGLYRSFPWSGKEKGLKAAGLDRGGPLDKYDDLDEIINGNRARRVYWRSTREWLTDVLNRDIENQALKDGPIEDMDTARAIATSWSGYCLDAAAAAYFAPVIQGPKTVLGVEFSEWDISVLGTFRWSGLAREPLDLNNIEELTNRIANGEAVAVNYSEVEGQDWWGLGREIDNNGRVLIVKATDLDEDNFQTIKRDISNLRGAYMLHEDRAEPGYAGNFAFIDRRVGGLIVGTHQLIAA